MENWKEHLYSLTTVPEQKAIIAALCTNRPTSIDEIRALVPGNIDDSLTFMLATKQLAMVTRNFLQATNASFTRFISLRQHMDHRKEIVVRPVKRRATQSVGKSFARFMKKWKKRAPNGHMPSLKRGKRIK